MGHCFSNNRSLKKVKKKKIFFFYFSLFGKYGHGIGKKGGYFQLGMGPKFRPLEMGTKFSEPATLM